MKKLTFAKIWNDLFDILNEREVIHTLSRNRPNEITKVDNDGFWVMTKKSSPKSEHVPKWMFETAITHLIEHGSLTNIILLNELNVKRSSFVLAALSQLDYVGFESDPLKIFLK
jgi:hypothetical protein